MSSFIKTNSISLFRTRQGYGHNGLPIGLQKLMAAVLLLLLSPLILITILLVKIESRGPVFFSQIRIGELGRHFHCYKFRSMYLKSDANYREPDPTQSNRQGVCKKYFQDPRITRVGRIIRKLSIDELPQLFNVLKGDMLLIGPRPPLVCEYQAYNRNTLRRLYCIPGITGLWQINGRADTDFEQQLELDKQYIQQQTIWLDVKILLMTIPAVLSTRGAY